MKAPRLLQLSPTFSLPLDFVLRSAVIYGAPESGKTTTAAVIAEEAWKQGVRFCAIDPKGDWYGVKSTKDGQEGAIPAVVFGGDRCAHREVFVLGRIPRGICWEDTCLADAETGQEASVRFPVSDVLITPDVYAELLAIQKKLLAYDHSICRAFGGQR